MTDLRKVVFPVAGMGTRFLPATKATPKEMLPILDKPLIQYGVEEALSAGMKDVIMVTGRGKRAIEDHFDISVELEANLRSAGKGDLYEQVSQVARMANIAYIRQKEPKGLGHAVLCARDWVGDECFGVSLADELMVSEKSALSQLRDLHEKTGASVVGLVRVPADKVSRYGIVAAHDEDGLLRIDRLVEKPAIADAPSDMALMGRYIFTPRLFDYLEKQTPGSLSEIQLTDAMDGLAKEEPMYGVILDGARFDAGNPVGFLQANIALGLNHPDYAEALKQFIRTLPI
ncbi:MAG: UTP--glucose-1-phosphate uridylyltransferase GalU [Zetaproteobacteria bacterium]|nr:UTP--glucose-1-phosphate uridylyltransferase GalU [Zetaproteobacteria bacterium]